MLEIVLPGREDSIELDLLDTLLVIKRIEEKFDLVATDKKIRPSVPFLNALAKELTHTLDLQERLTSAAAWQIWLAVYRRVEIEARRYEAECDLAYWYGFNTFALTGEQKAALLANLPRVKAQDRLHSGKLGVKSAEGAYNLAKLATGSEKVALRFRGDWIEAEADKPAKRRSN